MGLGLKLSSCEPAQSQGHLELLPAVAATALRIVYFIRVSVVTLLIPLGSYLLSRLSTWRAWGDVLFYLCCYSTQHSAT